MMNKQIVTTTTVEIPAGHYVDCTFRGSPPVVDTVDVASPLNKSVQIGLHVKALRVPGMEIFNFKDTEHLLETLSQFHQMERTLVLTDVQIGGPTMFHISLPSGKLGITLKGFPPVVTSVNTDSPIVGRLAPGMVVEQLIVPGCAPFSLASGGFTDLNVTKRLTDHSHVEGRVLVLMFAAAPNHPQQQGARDAFDVGFFKGSWGIKRMFYNPDRSAHTK
jgi:hypothetical protein